MAHAPHARIPLRLEEAWVLDYRPHSGHQEGDGELDVPEDFEACPFAAEDEAKARRDEGYCDLARRISDYRLLPVSGQGKIEQTEVT